MCSRPYLYISSIAPADKQQILCSLALVCRGKGIITNHLINVLHGVGFFQYYVYRSCVPVPKALICVGIPKDIEKEAAPPLAPFNACNARKGGTQSM